MRRISWAACFVVARWVYAGKSRFLSVDPAGKKHGQWGSMKEADAPQENSPDE